MIGCFVLFQVFVVLVHARPNHRNVEKIMTNLVQNDANFDINAYRRNQLNLHNHYRSLHGVPPMTRDATLEAKAQEYAEILAAKNKGLVHCNKPYCDRQGAGENLAAGGGSNMNAAKAWYKEVWDYNYCHNERNFNRPGHAGKATGHFTQVVWKTSTKLGIGFARSADKKTVYVVGRYLAHGNVGGLYGKNVLKANYLFHTFQNNCNGKNGRFSAWSKPGECSQSCGGGIRFKTRTCTNPKPSLNGGDCYGTTSQLAAQQWCNTQSCPEGDKSHRVQQCQARGLLAKSYTFNNNQCGLFCHSGSGNIYTGAGKVDDGTHCNSDSGVCMDGQCKTMPKYESSKSEQNTGAEEGEISGSYTDIPNANIWKNLILTVPNGAINVDITNYFYEDASICVGYKKSHGGMGYSFCENSWMNDHVAYYGEYKKTKTIAGVTFTYNRNKDYSEIYIDGPVHSTPGYSFVLFVKGSSEADIEWTYDV